MPDELVHSVSLVASDLINKMSGKMLTQFTVLNLRAIVADDQSKFYVVINLQGPIL